MKTLKKVLTMLLALTIILNTNMTAFANGTATDHNVNSVNTSAENDGNVVVTDTGVYINGTFYTKAEFIKLLDTAQEVQNPQSRSAIALVAGTWWIPGVGEVIITAAGAIIVAGVIVEAGSWIYDAVTDWFAKRAFNKSAEDAVNGCDSNKQNHIMQSKHNWNKFNKDPKWNDVAPILIKVLQEGTEKWEKNDQYIRTLIYKGETVVVRFIKDADGLVKYISTAWCE